ncbi:uncharacterized protein [Onthophagus taurus]|uniref:uncharacterized protein n=1 Tax=Onthophagus taurus TaxID=166361 RepID=UPI0039BE7AEB
MGLVTQIVTLISRLELKTRTTSTPNKTKANLSVVNVDPWSNLSDTSSDDSDVPDGMVGSSKLVSVTKWGISFARDGKSSLSAFLERVNELRVARGVSKSVLYTSAVDLFRDRALICYRANRGNFANWEELVEGLKLEFQPVDYDDRLFEEIRQRTQGPGESMGIYVSVMKNLFSRLNTRIPEDTQVKLMLKNLTPAFQQQLTLVEVDSVEHLLRLGRKLEVTKLSVDSYAPPNRVARVLEPDLAYIQTDETVSVAVAVEQSATTSEPICWNCQKRGHRARECRAPKRLHCFRCGEQGGATLGRCLHQANVKPIGVLLDFVFSHVRDDERPYLTVSVLGRKIVGLLDSGANQTGAGLWGITFIKEMGLPIHPTNKRITVANDESCSVEGVVSLPMELQGRGKIVEVLLVPGLRHELILGTDFWRTMGIVPDLRRGDWSFSKEPPLLREIIENLFRRDMESELSHTTLVEHHIRTNALPIKQRYYPISPAMQKVVDRELDEMLRLGVVERSRSAWSSPVLLVLKRDGGYRFCVDYRQLNKVTQADAYPLPQVSWTLDRLRDAKYLSSICYGGWIAPEKKQQLLNKTK